MIQKYSIFLILAISLFGGLAYSLGLPEYCSVITEILISLLILIALLSRKGKGLPIPSFWYVIAIFALISYVSIIINGSSHLRAIFSLRLLFRFFLMYLCITLLEPNDEFLKKINFFVLLLLVLQFPVIAMKFLHYGISEKTMGGYAVHDGAIATTLPISFIFYLAAFFFLYGRHLKYIFIAIGYIIFSIVSMKRAVFFLYPFQFMAIYFYIYIKGTGAHFTKKFASFFMFIAIVSIVSIAALHYNATLNPEKSESGSVDIGYAVDFAQKYNEGVNEYGHSYGRWASTVRAITYLWNSGIPKFVLGLGPGFTTVSVLDSVESRIDSKKRYNELRIDYGTTSIVKIALEYGLLGVLTFTSMLISFGRMCWKLYKRETDPYWRAFAAGSVGFSFSMLFFAYAYHATAFWGDTMPVLYFYAMAVAYVRYHKRPHIFEQNIAANVTPQCKA
jgi:hypothetical protein